MSYIKEIKKSVNEIRKGNINTVQDLISFHYGGGSGDVTKADAPLLTSTAGANNDVFGAEVFNQLNESVPAFAMLPKSVYRKAGFRVKTARGVTLGSSGVAENGAIPDTSLPTYTELSISLKHHVDPYNQSMLQDLRSSVDNDDLGLDQLRKDVGEEHVKSINSSILADVDTLAGNNFESIDRICSSQSEESALLTAGDADIYGFDRSGSTALDAYVDHNSGTDRSLSKEMLRVALNTIEENSGKRPNVILTGFDTYGEIQKLYSNLERIETARISTGINGVETAQGNDAGLTVMSVEGVPVVRDAQVQKDTISRIYFLNTESISFDMAMPTRNFETDDVLLLDALQTRGAYVTAGELKCTNFSQQGKIRDLS